MPADCQIDDCGVLAVGRCHLCDRAFCASHQAIEDRVRLVDRCSACQRDKAERAAQAVEAKRQAFLDTVRACEARPFPRLLAGAVLKDTAYPPQAIPWCLYDPALSSASLSDRDLRGRVVRDFIEEAQRRGVQPETRERSGRTVTKGFLKRRRWEAIYGDGWHIPGGSNLWMGGKSEGRFGAIVWTDGGITTDFENREAGLHDGALATMAGILGINTTPGG